MGVVALHIGNAVAFACQGSILAHLQTRCNLELEKDRLGERLEVEVRVWAASGVDRFMAGAIFPKCQHLDQRLTVWNQRGQHVSDEIYPAGKLTPYAMAARGPGSLVANEAGKGFPDYATIQRDIEKALYKCPHIVL